MGKTGLTSTRPSGPAVGPGGGRAESVFIAAGAVVITVGLVVAATVELTAALLAVGAAAYLMLLTVLGRERVVGLTVMGAFVTAPAYLGLAPSPSATITPTDVLLGLAVLLFLPTALSRRLHLPLVYWVGLGLVVVTGSIASVASYEPFGSFVNVLQWLLVLLGLPLLYVLWRPSKAWILALLWSYVVGHLASVAVAAVDGPLDNDRYLGLTHHPNAFAEAGLMVCAISLYLFHEHRSVRMRVVIVLVAAAGAQSILLGGSRASFLVLAVLIAMIPLVERSALAGVALGSLAGIGLAFLPFLVGISGEESALARLQGGESVAGADSARASANQVGWDLFEANPLLGAGYVIELAPVHNAYLQVAAGAGVFALVGYLLVLYPMARQLFGSHPLRRLSYLAWAYVGLAIALPSLWDRTVWVPMALAALTVVRPPDAAGEPQHR